MYDSSCSFEWECAYFLGGSTSEFLNSKTSICLWQILQQSLTICAELLCMPFIFNRNVELIWPVGLFGMEFSVSMLNPFRIYAVFCKGLLDLCCLKSTSSQKLQSDIEGLLSSSDSLSQCWRPLRYCSDFKESMFFKCTIPLFRAADTQNPQLPTGRAPVHSGHRTPPISITIYPPEFPPEDTQHLLCPRPYWNFEHAILPPRKQEQGAISNSLE